ncbi:MAG: hydrogenase small subunit [Coriobacteriales bacterium]|nr:hydrogenase small subunit [Coriobacteriales bacterium]
MAVQVAENSRLAQIMESRGISRRSFLGYCAGIAAMIGLSEAAAPEVAKALDSIIYVGAEDAPHALTPVIWMEGSSCTGCTESFAQVDTPDAGSVVLELISLNYCETLSAAAGHSMEDARLHTIEREKGKYILVYEGSVVEGWEGNALRVAGEKGTDLLLETAASAAAVVAFGSCACDGGWQAARPNPSHACGVQKFLQKNQVNVPVINIPCCPGNPEWLVAVLVEVILMGRIPELNDKNEPKLMFDQTIHDNCPRRGHFENGEFVYQFGSIEEEKGYCLYALGCKGPQTFTNCPIVKWNRRVSFCIESGAPCAGCGVINPMNPAMNWVDENTPFLARHRFFSFFGNPVDPALIAGVVTGVVVAALAVHGIGMKLTKRTDGGADFETIRKYDKIHETPNAAEYAAAADKLYDELDAQGLEERKANHRKGGDK